MKKKNKTRSVTGLLFGFMERVSGDHVGAYATQAAYFLIMSFYSLYSVSDYTGTVYTSDL
mgnify:FL=1